MKQFLSILIPVFNDSCVSLVKTLSHQASQLEDLTYELLVADDASTDQETLLQYQQMTDIQGFRLIALTENVGRSAIRNLLANEARYATLLFVDSGVEIIDSHFLDRYLRAALPAEREVVCGGITLRATPSEFRHNLRVRYETASLSSHTAQARSLHPYQSFRTACFLISRAVMLAHPLPERIRTYGYEDVLFGKMLEESNIAVTHIDNPVCYVWFEDNEHFVQKTEEAMTTLRALGDDVRGYSRLYAAARRLKVFHLESPFVWLYHWLAPACRRQLCGQRPSLWLFQLYKLGYFINS